MPSRVPPLTAAALTAAVAVLYLGIILSEPDPNDMGVVAGFVAALLLAAATAAGGAFERDPFTRRTLFGVAAVVTFVCAWLGALSIGPLLFPSVLLLAYATVRG
jgi:hypothetical protein